MTEELKVFRLNDCEWIVAKNQYEVMEWHLKTHKASLNDGDCEICEESTDMIVNVETEYVMDYLEEDEFRGIGFNESLECYQVPAHYIIKKEYKGEPFLLCSIG